MTESLRRVERHGFDEAALPPKPAAKFRTPGTASLITRERLLNLLDADPRCRLLLVHAPAGYGKSSLASQWHEQVRARGVRSIWLSIDNEDNSVVWYLSHLIESVRQQWPEFAQRQLDRLESGLPGFERRVVLELAAELEALAQQVALVIDDWHRVTTPAVIEVMHDFLEAMPASLQVLVASRNRRGLPLGKFAAHGQLIEVDSGQLRFDRDETEQFFTSALTNGLDDGAIESLHQNTGGWVAAMQLTRVSMRTHNNPAVLIRAMHGRHRQLDEYLVENVLNDGDPRQLDFLMRTSITERICPELASALTGRADAGEALVQIEADDLFLRPLDEEREWFRYHHLFADFLRARLARTDPALLLELHATAARWFATSGLFAEAVDHAVAANEPRLAVDIIEDWAMNLVEHSRMATLLLLVAKVPRDMLHDRPRLHLALAWGNALLQRRELAQAALGDFQAAMAASGETDRELLVEADACRAAVEIYADQVDDVPRLLEQALADPSGFRPWVVAVSANIDTFAKIKTIKFEEARQRQVWALKYHERTSGPFAAVYGQCFVAIADLHQLDTENAVNHAKRALVLADERIGEGSHGSRLAGLVLGRLLYEQGDLDAAQPLLEDGRELGGESGVVDFMIAIYCTLGRLLGAHGRVGEATQLLKEGEGVASELGLTRLSIEVQRVMLELGVAPHEYVAVGDACADAPGLRDSQLICDALRHSRTRALSIAAWGRLAQEFEEAASAAQSQGRRHDLLDLRLVGGSVLLHAQRETSAAKVIEEAILMAYDAGTRQLLLDAPLPVKQMYPRITYELGHNIANWLNGDVASVAGRSHHPQTPVRISPRERLILQSLAEGLTNSEIAALSRVSVNTIKWYLKGLYTRLGVKTRAECVALSKDLGLL